MLIVPCLLRHRNVPISPSSHVKERAWIFRSRRPSPDLLEARQDTFRISPVTPEDILHFHDRKPLWYALEQVRREVPIRQGVIDRLDDPQLFGGIAGVFQSFET